MSQMPTIHLKQPIVAASIIDAAQLRIADCGPGSKSGVTTLRICDREPHPQPGIRSPQAGDPSGTLQPQKDELDGLLKTVSGIVENLQKLHEETLAGNRAEIARLAVEI